MNGFPARASRPAAGRAGADRMYSAGRPGQPAGGWGRERAGCTRPATGPAGRRLGPGERAGCTRAAVPGSWRSLTHRSPATKTSRTCVVGLGFVPFETRRAPFFPDPLSGALLGKLWSPSPWPAPVASLAQKLGQRTTQNTGLRLPGRSETKTRRPPCRPGSFARVTAASSIRRSGQAASRSAFSPMAGSSRSTMSAPTSSSSF